jgi:hypothetical protein
MNQWQSRIVGLTYEPPESLLAHPKNTKIHPEVQQTTMRAALGTLGWLTGIIQNDETGFIIDGHSRIENAISTGQATIPVLHVRLSPEKEDLALATFDPIGALAVTDHEKMDELLADIQGADDVELVQFLASLASGVPAFVPGENEQNRLDEREKVKCPECGHEFAP